VERSPGGLAEHAAAKAAIKSKSNVEESQSSDVSHYTTVFLEVLVAIERSHSISDSSKSLELSPNFCFGHICSRLELGYLFTSIEIESSSLFTIVV